MKKTKLKSVLADSAKAAAAMLKMPVSRLLRAKAAGCRAFKAGGRVNLGELKSWFKTRPAKRHKRRTSIAADAKLEGAGPALARLERVEREAFESLNQAMRGGDADEIQAARDWFLQCSEQLRRSNANLDERLKLSGEILARSEVERVLQGTAYYCRVGLREALEPLARHFMAGGADRDCVSVINSVLLTVRDAVAASIKNHPWQGTLPCWAIEPVLRGFDADLDYSNRLSQALAAVMQTFAEEQIAVGVSK